MNNPYKHQEVALERYRKSAEIPLFFDPGTGKTRTSLLIAEAKFNDGDVDAVLVIAPNGVHKQWAVEEIPKWLSHVDTTVQWRKNKKLFFI